MEETNISQILKACRQKAGLTQAQFAETIGVKGVLTLITKAAEQSLNLKH